MKNIQLCILAIVATSCFSGCFSYKSTSREPAATSTTTTVQRNTTTTVPTTTVTRQTTTY